MLNNLSVQSNVRSLVCNLTTEIFTRFPQWNNIAFNGKREFIFERLLLTQIWQPPHDDYRLQIATTWIRRDREGERLRVKKTRLLTPTSFFRRINFVLLDIITLQRRRPFNNYRRETFDRPIKKQLFKSSRLLTIFFWSVVEVVAIRPADGNGHINNPTEVQTASASHSKTSH